ncbi:hypothetical protein HYW60_01535 [Candidatus Kaiserbacteria bacterium]|nr:hypothetical protein [Candidatus Kaiserbacteria bacterium]
MRWLKRLSACIRDTWQYRHEPEKLRVLADMYWRMLLILAALLFLLLAIFAGVKSYSIFEEEVETPLLSSGGGSIPFNTGELESALEQFEARRTHYEYLKKNPPEIADPSK